MNNLVLIFHPDLAHSNANRALGEAARAVPGATVVDMGALYPSAKVDVEVEVERLLNAGRLVLQFPLHWSSVPPLLKDWQDAVLTRMYYYNRETEGARLAGLPVMVATTAGNPPSGYGPGAVHLFPLEELLRPLQATASRCSWSWSDPFIMWSAVSRQPEEFEEEGQRYARRLTQWMADTTARNGN